MFQIADAQDAEDKKQPAAWHQTHNTYTQISCEDGLPALVFYCAAIFYCFQAIRIVRKGAAARPELRPYGDFAFCLRLSLIAFVITGIFASNAYYFFFPMLAGLSAALDPSVKAALKTAGSRPEAQSWLPPSRRVRTEYPVRRPRATPAPVNYR